MPKTKKATPEEIVLLWDNLDLTDKIKTFEEIGKALARLKEHRQQELSLLSSISSNGENGDKKL